MKTDNARGAMRAKVEIRQNVLAQVQPARVFDAFCGTGKMHGAVWSQASEYIGCDSRGWTTGEPHRRFVADNRLVMRSVDLSEWNVFDFDAYGSPWEQMLILAARRSWTGDERGAVVLTDGSSMKLRYGSMSSAMAQLLGGDRDGLPRSDQNSDALQSMLLAKWCALAAVKPIAHWRAYGRGSGRGGQRMTYTGMVFAGQCGEKPSNVGQLEV